MRAQSNVPIHFIEPLWVDNCVRTDSRAQVWPHGFCPMLCCSCSVRGRRR